MNSFARDFKLSPRESVEFVKLRSGTRSSKQWHGELGAFSDFKSEQQLDRAGVGCGLQCSQQCFACDPDRSGKDGQGLGYGSQQSRFATPVGAEQGNDLAFPQRKADSGEDRLPVISCAQPVDREQRFAQSSPASKPLVKARYIAA